MAGQGLGPLVNKKPDILIAPPSRSTLRLARRDSPTYDPYRSARARSLDEIWFLSTAVASVYTKTYVLLQCLG